MNLLRLFLAVFAMAVVTPVAAHPGDHVRLSAVELIQHYTEPDHLAFLALSALVGCVAYRHSRRAEARQNVTVAKRDEPTL